MKNKKQSFSSKVIERTILLVGLRKRYTKENALKAIEKAKIKNSKPYKFPRLIRMKALIEKQTIDGMDYYIVNKKEDEKNVILYMHGGAYMDQPVYFHWKFIEKVAIATDYTIYVPIYPKSPTCTYVECYQKVLKLYLKIVNEDGDFAKNIAFMGDSAGGGFVLAFAQYLRNNGIKQNANNIIMISPWLDLSMQDPDMEVLEKVDPSIRPEGILEMAKVWAGGSDFNNYMISPINGTFENLGKMTIFIGTHDILLSSARKLRDILSNKMIDFNYYEYPNMDHVFPLFPIIPEAKSAKKIIYNILNESKKWWYLIEVVLYEIYNNL